MFKNILAKIINLLIIILIVFLFASCSPNENPPIPKSQISDYISKILEYEEHHNELKILKETQQMSQIHTSEPFYNLFERFLLDKHIVNQIQEKLDQKYFSDAYKILENRIIQKGLNNHMLKIQTLMNSGQTIIHFNKQKPFEESISATREFSKLNFAAKPYFNDNRYFRKWLKKEHKDIKKFRLLEKNKISNSLELHLDIAKISQEKLANILLLQLSSISPEHDLLQQQKKSSENYLVNYYSEFQYVKSKLLLSRNHAPELVDNLNQLQPADLSGLLLRIQLNASYGSSQLALNFLRKLNKIIEIDSTLQERVLNMIIKKNKYFKKSMFNNPILNLQLILTLINRF